MTITVPVTVAALAIGALAVSVGAAAAYVVSAMVRTALDDRRRQARDRLHTIISSWLATHARGAGPVDELAAAPYPVAVEVLWRVARDLQGPSRAAVARLAGSAGVTTRTEKRLRDRRWWRRLHAVRLLSALGPRPAAFTDVIVDPHPDVRAEALLALAGLDARPPVKDIVARWRGPSRAERIGLARALGGPHGTASDDLVTVLLEARRAQAEDLLPLLDVAHETPYPDLLPALETLGAHGSVLVRARVADVVGRLAGAAGSDLLTRLAHDREAPVRAAAARALGGTNDWRVATVLTKLMSDPYRRVRHRAAEALHALGPAGQAVLHSLAAEVHGDAAAAARRALAVAPVPRGVP